MITELSKELRCILIRANIEIWLEKDRIEKFISVLQAQKQSTFVEIDGQVINTADVVGVFTPEKMEERTRRSNGEWRCKENRWHERLTKCDCPSLRIRNGRKERFTTGRGWEDIGDAAFYEKPVTAQNN